MGYVFRFTALCAVCYACMVSSTQATDTLQSAKNSFPWMQKIRRTLHQWPELMYEEVQTSQLIRDTLDGLDIKYKYPYAKTGIVATIGTGTPVVGLRADMDALPVLEPAGLDFRSKREGIMHACGHDSHVTMLLGAANVLKARESSLKGTIKLLFQPAEEGGAGANVMVEEGALEGIDAIFALHTWPTLPVGTLGGRAGTIMAGAAAFNITVRGKGGHAAMPHLNIDPVVAAAHIVTALQTLVSRETSPLDSSVISVTMLEAGAAHNLIPDVVTVIGTMRTLEYSTTQRLRARLEAMASSMAAAYGCEASVDWSLVLPYPPTVNDADTTKLAMDVGRELLGSGSVTFVEPTMAGEDFSFFALKVPGVMLFLGNNNGDGKTSAALHNPSFTLDENILPIGAAYLTEVAMTYLERASALATGSREEL